MSLRTLPLGNKIIFTSAEGLLVSDGTSSRVVCFDVGREFPAGIVALGNKVLFEAEDTSDKLGLWVTDGTSAGTIEITYSNFYFPGVFNEVGFQGAVINNEVVFSGTDSLGNVALWTTDGTEAGTKEIVYPTSVSDLIAVPPPAPPTALAVAAGSDSGVKGDDITNVTKPAITGTGVAGDTVTLYDGTTAIGTATVATAGTWSITPAAALAVGAHSLTATETGATGTSAASAALKLTIKVSAPVPSGLGFAVAADDATKGDTFTVAGSGEAGDTVTLYDGATAIGTAVVAAGGTWSITTASPLAAGAHSLSAHEVNVAANTSPSSPAQSLTVRNATPQRGDFVGTAGTDTFTGGAGNDIFRFPPPLSPMPTRSRAAAAATDPDDDRRHGLGGRGQRVRSPASAMAGPTA